MEGRRVWLRKATGRPRLAWPAPWWEALWFTGCHHGMGLKAGGSLRILTTAYESTMIVKQKVSSELGSHSCGEMEEKENCPGPPSMEGRLATRGVTTGRWTPALTLDSSKCFAQNHRSLRIPYVMK